MQIRLLHRKVVVKFQKKEENACNINGFKKRAYDKVDVKVICEILILYGIPGRLLNAEKTIYNERNACMRGNSGISGLK